MLNGSFQKGKKMCRQVYIIVSILVLIMVGCSSFRERQSIEHARRQEMDRALEMHKALMREVEKTKEIQ